MRIHALHSCPGSLGFRSLMLVALGLALGFTPGGLAIAQDFTMIDYPNATGTYALGINDAGDVVGGYTTAANGGSGPKRGFLMSAGKYTPIDYPGSSMSWVTGINSQGTMVGIYHDSGMKPHGFMLSKGDFTSLDYPGADATQAIGINSAGDIVGVAMFGNTSRGYLLRGGVWTALDYRPQAASNRGTVGLGINDAGVIVGEWDTRVTQHGLLYDPSKRAFTEINYGGGGSTEPYGINNAGEIAGTFVDAASLNRLNHGFLLKNGRFTWFDVPGFVNTIPTGINNSGQIVGSTFLPTTRGFVGRVSPAGPAGPVLTVDDDGLDCPGALPTIQEAVAKATAGATILVCPGTYRGTVNIKGPEKSALKLIAVGRANEVVLQGDATERDGFHLENVTNVLIRGFTVRDFGIKPNSATQWGEGNQIYLENADFNTIEGNQVINGDMTGIMLVDSAKNAIQNNLAWVNNAGTNGLATCGIHVQGAKSAGNWFRFNYTWGNKVAGIMLSNAGPNNWVSNNVVTGNGRDGISNTGTDGTVIEGNRASFNRGPWGASPFPADVRNAGRGISVAASNGVRVIDNRVRSNSALDIDWDGNGQVSFDSNACDNSDPSSACASSTAVRTTAEPAPDPAASGVPFRFKLGLR